MKTTHCHCYFTYATMATPNHSDLAKISQGLTALGIEHTVNPQTVNTLTPLTVKQSAQVSMAGDDWGIEGGANLCGMKLGEE
jgi:hypothetical protein